MEICPYCRSPAVLRPRYEITGLGTDLLWVCTRYPACDAYVGCHKPSRNMPSGVPLGTLANRQLRTARSLAHHRFDVWWQRGGFSRKEAYLMLADALNIEPDKAHIGMCNLEQCEAIAEMFRNPTLEKQALDEAVGVF